MKSKQKGAFTLKFHYFALNDKIPTSHLVNKLLFLYEKKNQTQIECCHEIDSARSYADKLCVFCFKFLYKKHFPHSI